MPASVTRRPIVLRPAKPDDEAALGRLGAMLVAVHHGFDAARFIAPDSGTAAGYGRYLVSQIGEPDALVLIAEAQDAGAPEGVVVGYAYAGLEGADWMALRGPAGAIYDLVVDPARRGEGLGRQLLEYALTALAERGAPRVVLSTAHRNAGAQRLFAAAGFRPTMVEMTRDNDAAAGDPGEDTDVVLGSDPLR